MDPLGISLVDARGTRGGTLGQCADGNKTLDDSVGILLALGHGAHQRLVAIRLRLNWVVSVPGQHTFLELADNLGTFSGGTHIWDGNWAHTGHASFAHIGKGFAFPMDCDSLGTTTHRVPCPENGTHCYLLLGKILRRANHKHLQFIFI